MHKADYIKLAEAVKGCTDNCTRENKLPCDIIIRNLFIPKLCDILQADNKNFDKVKFMEACK